MNTKLFKLITAGALAALLSSCGDTVVDNYDSNPVQTKATLNVRVRDAVSGNPLGATVTLNTSGASDTTNATGNISFKGVSIGSHSVLIEKAGYASAVYDAPIEPIGGGNISIAKDYTVEAGLYPKTASLSGVVVAEGSDGVTAALVGATVRFELTSDSDYGYDYKGIVDRVINTTTGADGSFNFPSLPAVGGNFALWISDAAKKYRIKQGPSIVLKTNLPTTFTNSIKFTPSDLNSLFELVSYPSVAQSTDTLAFTFNNKIDFAKFSLSSVSLKKADNTTAPLSGTNPTITRVASGDSTLRIALSGALVPTAPKWPNEPFKVCFNELKAIDGKVTATNYCSGLISTPDNSVAFELKNYKSRVDSNEAVVLTFSLPIDPAEFQPRWISISGISFERTVAGNSITLTPVGKWPNDFNVTIDPKLQATNGATLKTPVPSVSIVLDETDLSALQVGPFIQYGVPDYNLAPSGTPSTGAIKLRWKRLPGATKYLLYARASAGYRKGEFVYITELSNARLFYNPDSIQDSISNSIIRANDPRLGLDYADKALYPLGNGDTLELFIQAKNDISETSLAGAKLPVNTVRVTDIKKPSVLGTITYDSILATVPPSYNYYTLVTPSHPYPFPYNNEVPAVKNALTGTLANSNVYTTCVRFSEPVDTSLVPKETAFTFIVDEGAALLPAANINAKLKVTTKWGDTGYNVPADEALCFVVSSVATAAPSFNLGGSSSAQLRISVPGLKDKAGNVLNIIALDGNDKPVDPVTTLDIRFNLTGIDVAP